MIETPQINATDIEVVLFDLGGVLVELNGVPSLLSWMNHRVTPDELLAMWLSSEVVRAFESGRSQPVDFADQLIKEFDLPIEREALLADFASWSTCLLPGAVELVQSIGPDYKRAILSNSNVLHWPKVMRDWGLADLFDHAFSSHLMGKIKPDQEAFEHVIDALSCKPSAIVFLDDNMLNVNAARASGMQSVQAKGVAGARAVLTQAGILF